MISPAVLEGASLSYQYALETVKMKFESETYNLRLATRSSPLALAQAEETVKALEDYAKEDPDLTFDQRLRVEYIGSTGATGKAGSSSSGHHSSRFGRITTGKRWRRFTSVTSSCASRLSRRRGAISSNAPTPPMPRSSLSSHRRRYKIDVYSIPLVLY